MKYCLVLFTRQVVLGWHRTHHSGMKYWHQTDICGYCSHDRYCGDGIGRTIRSLNNTVILTLRTDHHQVAEDTGFNVTASLFIREYSLHTLHVIFPSGVAGQLPTGQLVVYPAHHTINY